MNLKNVKDKIKTAIKAVESEPEPYKIEAFKIILTKLIQDDSESTLKQNLPESSKKEKDSHNLSNATSLKGKENLAKICGIKTKELDEIISINNDVVQVIAPLKGSEPKKQTTASLCILLTYDTLFGKDWVDAKLLSKCLDKSGIGDLAHLARNLKKSSNMFRKKGNAGGTAYKMIGPGRNLALEVMKKLANGDEV